MAFYALEISITDWKLTNISPRLLTLLYSVGVAIFSLISLILAKETHAIPDLRQSIFILLMIFASFVAASAHFQALTIGTGAVRLTMVYMLLPVVATFYMFILKSEVPGFRYILAWIFAGIALYLISTVKN